jgi:precorrin-6B methylase 2
MGTVGVLVLEAAVVLMITMVYGTLFLTIFTHAPYVPTRKREETRFLRLAGIKPGERMFDFGSGDGRLVLAAARAGATATGVERQPLLVWISRWRARHQHLDERATFRRGDMFSQDISKADIVFCYLLPATMQKLKAKFERELKPGARVISNAFRIDGWTPAIEDRDGSSAPIFAYQR